MAAPTLALLNSTSIDTAESTTGWTKFDTLDTDIKKEGSNAITGTFRSDGTEGYFDNGSAPITAVGKTFRMWVNTTSLPYLTNEAGGGGELLAYDASTSQYITVFGSDTYFGGWYQVVIDMAKFTSLTLANVQRWGFRMQYTGNAKNVDNCWVDALKYLDGYSMVGGTSGDEVTFGTVELADRGTTTLYGYGVVTTVSGVYYCTGKLQFGTGATTMWFLSDGDILIFEDQPIATGLYELSGVGAGSRVTIKNSVIKSAGSTDTTRFIIDMSDTNLLSCTFQNNLIVRASTITFKSGQSVTNNTFDDCGKITTGAADFSGSIVKNYEGTADTGSIDWNPGTDPDTYTDGMAFTKGTAATHAIEFIAATPVEMTLRDIAFSGYNASDGQTDSTLLFPNLGTDTTWTVNLTGCSGNISYKKVRSGDTVNLVIDPITTTITVKDIVSNTTIEDVRVYLLAADATGDLPYQETVTSITRSGTTATVTHPSHGMTTGDISLIYGADQEDYNGAWPITVTAADTYTYVMNNDPGGSASGTLKATGGYFNELTNASGVVTDSRSISSDQPMEGWARKADTSPFYKQAPIEETVDSVNGLSLTVYMIPDE